MALNGRKRASKVARHRSRPRRSRHWTQARRLAEVREFERNRIARELHDQVGPILSLARLNLEALRTTAAGSGAGSLITRGMRLLDQAIEQVRTLSFELRPAVVAELGLGAAVASYARRARTGGMTVHVTAEPVDTAVSTEVAAACYRVLQEAVTNVMRHARARRLDVGLAIRAGALELRVADDGVGFDPAALLASRSSQGRLGLLGMQERAASVGGECSIASAPGSATVVSARFPLRRSSRPPLREADAHPPRR